MSTFRKYDIKVLWTIVLIGTFVIPVYAQGWKKGIQTLSKTLDKKTPLTGVTSVPRVKGADISKYSVPARKWASTYALNSRFLADMPNLSSSLVFSIEETSMRYASKGITSRFSKNNANLTPRQGQSVLLDFNKQMEWIKLHKEQLPDVLQEVRGADADSILVQKASESNLMFVGEIHGQVAGIEFANIIKKFRKSYPKRRVVVFLEALYLKPLASEEVFPYQYYRRGVEGVEEPFDIHNTKSPNFGILYADDNYSQMLEGLRMQHVEIYPVEDAVIVQKVSNAGKTRTIEGLLERNRGFARTMRAQMERIRQTDPDALFIYYGGMAHNSWVLPGALPKFFSDETSLVIELVSERRMETVSLAESWWGKENSALFPIGEKRIFFWQGVDKKLWGRNIGFDIRLVVP